MAIQFSWNVVFDSFFLSLDAALEYTSKHHNVLEHVGYSGAVYRGKKRSYTSLKTVLFFVPLCQKVYIKLFSFILHRIGNG